MPNAPPQSTGTPATPVETPSGTEARVRRATVLNLVELDPQLVVHGKPAPGGLVAPVATPAGTMREVCPHCHVPLQLVLRHQHVIQSHLFCRQCTRCFDALNTEGRSVLALAGWSID